MIHDKSVNCFASLSIYAWSNEGHSKAKPQLWTTCRHQEKQKASNATGRASSMAGSSQVSEGLEKPCREMFAYLLLRPCGHAGHLCIQQESQWCCNTALSCLLQMAPQVGCSVPCGRSGLEGKRVALKENPTPRLNHV